MNGLLARRPSPALIVALIALVLTMVGTGYAAIKLPKKSVGTKQLKKNAVTTAKVKNEAITGVKLKKETVTGDKIKLSTLGAVPLATHALSADSTPPAEATHYVGESGQPGFNSGSHNAPGELGVSFTRVGFFKDHDGVVHLQGLAAVGEGGPLPSIFTLPPGDRPANNTIMILNVFCFSTENCEEDEGGDEEIETRLLVVGSNTTVEGVDLSGMVIAAPNTEVSLDSISFRAES